MRWIYFDGNRVYALRDVSIETLKRGKKRECEGTAIEELRVLTTEAHFKRTHDAYLSQTPYLFTFESVDMSKSVGPSISNARACTENSPPTRFSSRIIFPCLCSTKIQFNRTTII